MTLSGTLLLDANVASIQSPAENVLTISLKDVNFASNLITSTELQTALANISQLILKILQRPVRRTVELKSNSLRGSKVYCVTSCMLNLQ